MMTPSPIHSDKKALWSLILLVPAPSFGVLMSLQLSAGTEGSLLWALSKVWLFLGPLVWLCLVEKIKLPRPKISRAGLWIAFQLGIMMLLVIWGAYLIFALEVVDGAQMRAKLAQAGLTSPRQYLMMACYWTFINALLEEYVFRFFMFRQSEKLWGSKGAVIATALFFTLHHTLALAVYFPWWQNVLASLGVFSGSIIWSWLYARYRTIWPGYLCHIFADIAVFSVGWHILYGV